jgi:RimJ/RimL family protein N-acetyltransferase
VLTSSTLRPSTPEGLLAQNGGRSSDECRKNDSLGRIRQPSSDRDGRRSEVGFAHKSVAAHGVFTETWAMKSLEEIWPLFGLRIRSGPLELAAVRDDDIPLLVALAERGIHDPAKMPFAFPWTDAPKAQLARNMAVHYWESRTKTSPDRWSLELVVRSEGAVAGIQAFAATNYLVTRTGETGSWLSLDHQGQGIGTLMRQTMCAFLFDHLDAEEITSAAFVDNPSSMAVSRKVGYSSNGETREKRRDGELAICRRLVLRPKDLVRSAYELEVEGLAALRHDLGLAD